MPHYSLEEVFGSSRDVPINYIRRQNIDDAFIQSLSGEKHIVIYGSSKQGKTCLRKKHLVDQDQYIFIQCSEKLNISSINKLILKKAGVSIQVSEKKEKAGQKTVKGKIGFNLFGNKAGAETELRAGSSSEIEKKSIEIDTEDTNDIIHILSRANFTKFIILDEFHFLNFKTQKDIAIALKAYHESSRIVFIIIGVWLDNNRLVVLNGNLGSRLISINVDDWDVESLMQVIDTGADLLNIEFERKLKEEIIDESFDNVNFVQEICNKICEKFRISSTQELDSDGKRFYISSNFDVKEISKNVINQYSGRYTGFITQFSEGFDKDKLDLYKWIVFSILDSEVKYLQDGLKTKDITKKIRKSHSKPKKITKEKIRNTLAKSVRLQTLKEVTPLIIDFNKSEDKLTIIDKEFFIWLSYQNKEHLISSLDLKKKKRWH
jgi:hypothetical protein